jgi:hypothetical protein
MIPVYFTAYFFGFILITLINFRVLQTQIVENIIDPKKKDEQQHELE